MNKEPSQIAVEATLDLAKALGIQPTTWLKGKFQTAIDKATEELHNSYEKAWSEFVKQQADKFLNLEQRATKAEASNAQMREALEFIAKQSQCECWNVPGMGSGLPYVWKGCPAHLSTDENEWCLTCVANKALSTTSGTYYIPIEDVEECLFSFPAITGGNAEALAYHADGGKPFCGIDREALVIWLRHVDEVCRKQAAFKSKHADKLK